MGRVIISGAKIFKSLRDFFPHKVLDLQLIKNETCLWRFEFTIKLSQWPKKKKKVYMELTKTTTFSNNLPNTNLISHKGRLDFFFQILLLLITINLAFIM